MVGYPWFLMAFGIAVVLIGFFLIGMSGSSSSRDRGINRRMNDREIMRQLQRAERIPFPNWVIVFGMLCMLASVVWRLVRYFL